MRPPRQLPRYRADLPYGWVLGHFPALELLRHAPQRALEVRVHRDLAPERAAALAAACESAGVPLVRDDAAVVAKRSKGTARVLALFEKGTEPLRPDADHLLLIRTNEPGNAGTMLRTALAFGVADVAVVRVDPFGPHVLRASLGAAFALRIGTFRDVAAYRETYPGRRLVLLDGGAEAEVGELGPLPGPTTVGVGPEWPGLGADELDLGTPARIAMDGRVESLNVAVAAGVALRVLLPAPAADPPRRREA